MDKEIIDKIMFDNFLKPVPTKVVDAKDRKTISAYGSIGVNDLTSAIDRLDKVPTYDELLKENKKQKEVIDKMRRNLENSVESINQKILDDKQIKVKDGRVLNMNDYQLVRLKAFKTKCSELLNILNEVSE